MKSLTTIAAAVFLLGSVSLAQTPKKLPVQWILEPQSTTVAPGAKFAARLTAKIDSGWHMYSLTTPKGGGLPTTIKIDNPAVAGFKVYEPKPDKKFDPNFKVDTERYEGEAVFLAEVELAKTAAAGPLEIAALIRYSACTDKECLPPRKVTAAGTIAVDPKASAASIVIPSGYIEAKPALAAATAATPTPAVAKPADQGLGTFLLIAFGAGLAAVFTPCVFPMIPITLSFFLNRQGATRGASIWQAGVFCLGIILMFTALGLGIAAAVGPFGVVQLAANPWVNGFICVVFLVFGLSLLGAFEITLPSALVNKMDRASQSGGVFGTLLMGLTFSLTSFACVGPFVGSLLAASVQQGGVQPALGMMAFAAGLSSPFFLLAMFPSYLKRMPKSGGWLVRVKIVVGFIVLAVMLKYLSSIDQVLQWNVLTRERFLAAWFVLFLLPGLYLLGFLHMEGIGKDEPLGVKRLLIGAFFVIFSMSLLPGMFGRPLGELDSYVPLITGPNGSGPASEAGLVWMKNQYPEALAKARAENKLVFVNFTGYACTNCHWMKANMFTRPEIAAAFKGFVLLELYTDGTDADSEKNQKLQESKFSTIAIPFYAIVDPNSNDKIVATWGGIQRNPSEYLAFLQTR